eukprot:scaffold25935_cov12-Tisochrysis_lutea.AAC.1
MRRYLLESLITTFTGMREQKMPIQLEKCTHQARQDPDMVPAWNLGTVKPWILCPVAAWSQGGDHLVAMLIGDCWCYQGPKLFGGCSAESRRPQLVYFIHEVVGFACMIV